MRWKTLVNVAGGVALKEASLRRSVNCRACRKRAGQVLRRWTTLHPRGIRGYYACTRCHRIIAIDRAGVTRLTRQDGRRLYFA